MTLKYSNIKINKNKYIFPETIIFEITKDKDGYVAVCDKINIVVTSKNKTGLEKEISRCIKEEYNFYKNTNKNKLVGMAENIKDFYDRVELTDE